MPHIEPLDFRRRREIPTKYKTLLVLVCILGIVIHSFWNKSRVDALLVDYETIMFEEINTQSLVVNFVIDNTRDKIVNEKVKIEIIDQDNYLITSTIKYLDFNPGRNIFSEQIKYSRRFPDIKERELRAIITFHPRKL